MSQQEEEELAEIRSTLDLIMERTSGMTLSEEERERLHREELEGKTKGYRMKLLEDPAKADQIPQLLREESEEDRSVLERLIWQEMVLNLPLDKDLLQYLDLMARLPQGEKRRHILDKLRNAFKASLKSAAGDRKRIVAREKKKLAALGVSGSAVLPKLPKDPEPDPAFLQLVAQCKKELLGESAN